MEGELLITHTDVSVSSFFDDSTSVNGLDDGVNSVVKVLNHHGVTFLDSKLNGLHKLGVGKTGDLKVSVLHALLKPSNTLELGIDDQRVALRVGQDSAVFNRDLIRWKFVIVPGGHLSWSSQDI